MFLLRSHKFVSKNSIPRKTWIPHTEFAEFVPVPGPRSIPWMVWSFSGRWEDHEIPPDPTKPEMTLATVPSPDDGCWLRHRESIWENGGWEVELRLTKKHRFQATHPWQCTSAQCPKTGDFSKKPSITSAKRQRRVMMHIYISSGIKIINSTTMPCRVQILSVGLQRQLVERKCHVFLSPLGLKAAHPPQFHWLVEDRNIWVGSLDCLLRSLCITCDRCTHSKWWCGDSSTYMSNIKIPDYIVLCVEVVSDRLHFTSVNSMWFSAGTKNMIVPELLGDPLPSLDSSTNSPKHCSL